jgi:hypothetical protein
LRESSRRSRHRTDDEPDAAAARIGDRRDLSVRAERRGMNPAKSRRMLAFVDADGDGMSEFLECLDPGIVKRPSS